MNFKYFLKKMIPARVGISLQFYHWFHKFPNLRNPQTFNEKLLWLKLYDHNPNYIPLVDKYEAKKIIGKMIGEEHIIQTLDIWDSVDAIDFNSLPNQFVLKCTHDSGSALICDCKSIFDLVAAQKKLLSHLKRSFYYYGYEWPYKHVKPRIIAEQYLVDESGTELKDYKFMCFGGRVKSIFVASERFSKSGLKVTFFDREWNRQPFARSYPTSSVQIKKPENLEKMIQISEQLTSGYPFARVDLYSISEKVYFGELTLYPGSGLESFQPEEWDYTFGSWIQLPNIKRGISNRNEIINRR